MAVMMIPVTMVAMVAVGRVKIAVMAGLDQHIAPVVMMMMARHDDHLVVVAMMVMMPMAGFDNNRLSAGCADKKQCRYAGEQKLLHFTFS